MKRAISALLIIGFIVVDFLFFHDVFKPGEMTTLPQILTGILSVIVMVIAGRELLPRPSTGRDTIEGAR